MKYIIHEYQTDAQDNPPAPEPEEQQEPEEEPDRQEGGGEE